MKNSKLFEKIVLNNKVEIKNRIAIAPITLYASNPDGSMTDEEREYLKIRGTDIGIYIFGASYVSKEGMTSNDFHFSISEKDIPGLEERAKIIKSQGAKVINQINHAGCFAQKKDTGLSPVVPSADIAIKDAQNRGSNSKDFHELTDSEIKELIGKYAYAVELCKKFHELSDSE